MIHGSAHPRSTAWPEVLRLALKLGFTAFGGPAAHIAMLREEVVVRRAWLSDERFLELLGAVHLIPGPNSTELVMHVGLERAGWRGWLAGGLGFILPAASITLALAWTYVEFGTRPAVAGVLYGIKPVVVAVVVQAIWGLGQTAFKTWSLALVALLVVLASLMGANELILLFGGALLVAGLETWRKRPSAPTSSVAGIVLLASSMTAPLLVPVTLTGLFWSFLKIGSLLYGSGYVLVAFLRNEFVTRLGWLTEAQLLDAIAMGQVTPGPVFSSATFVGYVVAGFPGAALATTAIFAPAFVFVPLVASLFPRLRRWRWTALLLDGVNASALGLMVAVTLQLGRTALVDGWTVLMALVSSVALVRYKVNSLWLILMGAVVGVVRG